MAVERREGIATPTAVREVLGDAVRRLAVSSEELWQRIAASSLVLGQLSPQDFREAADRRLLDSIRLRVARLDLTGHDVLDLTGPDVATSDAALEAIAHDVLRLRNHALLRAFAERQLCVEPRGARRWQEGRFSRMMTTRDLLDQAVVRLATAPEQLRERLERSVELLAARREHLETEEEHALYARVQLGLRRLRPGASGEGARTAEDVPMIALESTASHMLELRDVSTERLLQATTRRR